MADSNPFAMNDPRQQLAMFLMSLGSGVGAAGAAGRPFHEGLAPAAAMYGNAQAQNQQNALQWQTSRDNADLRKRSFALQEAEFNDKRDERKRQEQVAMGWAPPGGASVPGMGPQVAQPTIGPGGDVLNRSRSAIGGMESSNRYDAIGPDTGGGKRAYGKYQVMDFNIGPWTQEVLGAPMTKEEFLANPQAQDRVFEVKFGQSIQKYGNPQDAASVWFSGKPLAGNTAGPDVLGTTVAGYVNKFNRGFYGQPGQTADTSAAPTAPPAMPSGGPTLPPSPQRPTGTMIAQGSGDGSVVPVPAPTPPQVPRPSLPPDEAARIQRAVQTRQITPQQGDAEANRIITDLWNRAQGQADAAWKQQHEQYRFDRGEAAKTEQWYTLGPDDVKMYPGLDPSKPYQRNKKTGEVKPVGGSLVNIDQKGQTEFAKEMGKIDAKRFGEIMAAETTMSDMASKLGFALDQLSQTYTGPGAETANEFFKTLGKFGSEDMAKKANAADAAQAVISQMKPHMRASGSGASSDRDMDMFAKALPSLLNTPDGNQRIGAYFQRLADRATQVRQLAQEHSEGGKIPLTDTKFDDAVKKLGPLFSKDELAEMQNAAKTKAKAEPPAPPAGFKVVTPGGMSPMPNTPPPPAGFRVMSR